MDTRVQLLAILGTGALLLVVLELVRRRRLQERYALLWLVSAVVLLVLASWRGALSAVASLIGIAYPPNALFFLAFAAILIVLLHFSMVISRLSDQTKVLAQRVAMLDERLRRQEDHVDDAVPAEAPELSRHIGSRFSSS
jgi:hypothetical protein